MVMKLSKLKIMWTSLVTPNGTKGSFIWTTIQEEMSSSEKRMDKMKLSFSTRLLKESKI